MKKLLFFVAFVAISSQICFGQSYQDYLWLTDCARQRQEFTPPDSTTLLSEPCGDSQKFLLLSGPDLIEGDFHTNDFIFFGPPNPVVTMLGCVTANGNYFVPSPIPAGSLQFPNPPLAGVSFLDSCNLGDTVAYSSPFIFDSQLSNTFILNSQNGGLVLQEDSLMLQRIVFDTLDIKIQKATSTQIMQSGPQSWITTSTLFYPQNGAFYVEGDVYVSGIVNGDLTLGATGNIFIDNDLKYECTDSTGMVLSQNCDDKLGLVSEMNIFLETRHIATNKGFSWTNFDSTYAHNNHQEGVIVNAGIITYGESFGVFTADFPNFARFPGDPYGGMNNPNFPFLGNHGTIKLLGTIAQKRKGITDSGIRGGYGGNWPTQAESRIYHYDSRFATSPPQNFPMKITSVKEKSQIPSKFKLEQNYPNPFNPTTTINYDLEISHYQKSRLVIFNILGEKVKEFVLSEPKGSVVWNGTNNLGKEVSSGVYFYRLETNTGFSKVKKMVFLK